MKKRLIAMGLVLVALLAGSVVQAAPKFDEELHYFSVIPEQPGGEGERIQVVEFFWYGCSHCYNLEPHLQEWLKNKPDNVDFEHIPALFNRANVVMHAKTYYALKLLGKAEQLHESIFKAMHEEKRRMNTQEELYMNHQLGEDNEPEKLDTLELIYSGKINERLSFQASGFLNRNEVIAWDWGLGRTSQSPIASPQFPIAHAREPAPDDLPGRRDAEHAAAAAPGARACGRQ